MRWCIAFTVFLACGARTEPGAPIAEVTDAGTDANADAPIDAPVDAPPNDCGASLASGPSWQTSFGPARLVCLDASYPANCPSGALLYGANGPGWGADISSLAGAGWIWRPGISPSDLADNAEVTFTRTFILSGAPDGTISISADDFAQVVVNGIPIGSVGSTMDSSASSFAQSTLTTFDLGSQLVSGANTITIIGRNGPAYFAGCPGTCSYAQNPAGVVFGGHVDCH
jgi:hypothetical protein